METSSEFRVPALIAGLLVRIGWLVAILAFGAFLYGLMSSFSPGALVWLWVLGGLVLVVFGHASRAVFKVASSRD